MQDCILLVCLFLCLHSDARSGEQVSQALVYVTVLKVLWVVANGRNSKWKEAAMNTPGFSEAQLVSVTLLTHEFR